MLRSISLRARLYWMCAAFVVGMVGIVGMEEATLRYAAVDGPVYVELVQDKDLLADILPPPLYALEARLVSARLAASPSAADIATLAARLQQLQDEYDSRADYWETTLPQGPIRTHVLGRARTESTRMFEAVRDHVLPAAQRGDFADAARADRDEVEPAYVAHRAAIDTAVAQLNEQAQARAVAARATVHSRRVWTLALATLACVGVSALSVLTSRHVARGVSRNAEAIRAVEQRDLTVHIEPSGDDDLGRMGRALNRAVSGLRAVLGGFRSHAGDVAARAGTLRTVSRELTDRADAASRSSADVDRAMGEVTERLTRIAASAEQLRLAISEISRHSNEASTVASEGVRHVSESSEHMERLAASSSEVDAVVKAIGGVARQTSLLALNATIEAARAGESGQGFAVVANEVKDLARKAHAAAEDASSRIRAMQADTEGARRTLGAVRELVERIHEFQSSVAAAVTEQEATTSEIQRAVSEAAESSTHVGTTVRRLADASAATQSSAATTLAAAEALGVTAEELQTAAGQFRLEAA